MGTGSQRPMSAGMAVAIGHLMITLPMLIISCMAVTLLVLISRNWRLGILGLIVGVVAAGVWWGIATPMWRRWALGRGVAPEQLQRWAMLTGLVMPGDNKSAGARTTPAATSMPEQDDEPPIT